MSASPGQNPGHAPVGLGWQEYVAWLVSAHGSLARVALELANRARRGEAPESIERALRRLRKSQGDGGAYGPRLVRAFGLPADVAARTAWMGLYHSRFCDLPVPVCGELLRAWDRPPITLSSDGAFIALGLAHVALRMNDLDGAEAQLARAAEPAKRLAPGRLEHVLASAYLASSRGERQQVAALLGRASMLASDHALGPERAAFIARLQDQLAYQTLHPVGRAPDASDLERAFSLYDAIDPAGSPFVRTKRALGLAYVAWKRGEAALALREARAAVTHAGDGGLLRQRGIALGLLGRIAEGTEAADARARAIAIAMALSDEDLRLRQARPAPR